jgi:hypothetical protein
VRCDPGQVQNSIDIYRGAKLIAVDAQVTAEAHCPVAEALVFF